MSDTQPTKQGADTESDTTAADILRRPDFKALHVETIEATLDALLLDCRQTVQRVIEQAGQGTPTWHTLVQPQAEAHNALSLFWSPVSHLNSVMHSEALREVHKRCLAKLTGYWTELGQNRKLYEATRALRDGASFADLSCERRREVENDLRDFELGGVSLDADQQTRFKAIAEQLSRMGSEFSDAVLDATNEWRYRIEDEARLDGLPASAVAAAAERARVAGVDGWLLNLEFPTYHAVVTFATDRALRQRLYTAFATRASDRWPDGQPIEEQEPHAARNNASRIDRILALRAEKAALLGFTDFAELSMVTKMVTGPDEVQAFLDDLATRAVPAARQEQTELEAFAQRTLGLAELQAWDIAFVAERLRRDRYDLSAEALKPYFPADRVIPGLFEVVSRLFDVSIETVEGASVYHPDVTLHRILDGRGELRGEFYLDNYARADKRGGAWMDVCATRQRVERGVQVPIAYLTCNLTPPVGDDPALLTHDEVITLFHEFGHGLHHLLTRVEAPGVSGINGVEWDAVELPSQFLENWCWERESLDLISGHYRTGDPLPDSLLDKLRAARGFRAASALVRQLEFSLFDLDIHRRSRAADDGGAVDVRQALATVRERVSVAPVPAFNRFPEAFSHIFAGGYAAGYFSYKWAEVLSADAFERFAEDGLFDRAAGQAFRTEILERGGSRDAMQSYVAFRGREPSIEPLLRQAGLMAA